VPDEVPADVIQLLNACIEGYEHLEALVVMRREQQRMWTAEAIASALNVSDASADKALEDLARAGLLQRAANEPGPAYSFRPAAHLAQTAERLMTQYDENRIAIVQLMNANAIARVRGRAVQAFADAFVLGRKKSDG
jgi:predicted transcriptional regulator